MRDIFIEIRSNGNPKHNAFLKYDDISSVVPFGELGHYASINVKGEKIDREIPYKKFITLLQKIASARDSLPEQKVAVFVFEIGGIKKESSS
ncbi:hypothetical protein PHA77_01865 [Edwardsiella tarda]|uniref:hypothetical protein n=1 Tax=Edwardsiella tarda TaxID=636 RepID=UPI0024440D89|nr:hypothetical protein [Edwardsiella tarda]WGE29439.1 hypothetical protein PHA77_01865 [Edwardsiella tarda]